MEQKQINSPFLELILKAKALHVPLHQAVLVTVMLRNICQEPITVNGRLLLNYPTAPDSAREIGLAVKGPPGYINLKKFHVNAGPPTIEQFVCLQPDAAVQREYDLSQFFSLHMAGAYNIVATYTNRNQMLIDSRLPWIGTLTSENVTITRV